MDRQARNGDTVLIKSREMTGRTQRIDCRGGLGGGGVKTTENKIRWTRCTKYSRPLHMLLELIL